MAESRFDQPEMFGERIWLRPIELRDALVLAEVSLEVDPDWSPVPNVAVSETAFRAWIQSLDDTELVWAVCRSEHQEAIGTASIRGIDLQHRTAETGMGLFYAEDRGQGIGGEIKALLLDFAFDVMGLHTVKCTIDARNTRSQRSVAASGYTKVGSFTADVPMGLGQYADTLVYQLLASEWRARKPD